MGNHPAIGVYEGACCGAFHLEAALKGMGIGYATFGDDDLLGAGFGEGRSTLVLGAGHVSGEATALGGAAGRQRVRDLVGEGRTYIGICAGAYLALLDEPGGLGLVEQELDHAQSGNIFQGFLTVEYPRGSGKRFPLWYQNGPVFPRDAAGAVAVFAQEQEHGSGGCSAGATLGASDFAGRPGAIERVYGNGRCVLVSPHPELGSIGIEGYAGLVASWMRREFPEEYRAHPNRGPVGRARARFLGALGEVGLLGEAEGAQWGMLGELVGGG